MKKGFKTTRTDVEEAHRKILDICREYNCKIEWEDCSPCILVDKDNSETVGFHRM